ncbi:MAG TPA: membrane dipeptidase [Vicinamibacteria bacterium]|nr:membrane dipeptidase [Vicinamibacteria bacterium]
MRCSPVDVSCGRWPAPLPPPSALPSSTGAATGCSRTPSAATPRARSGLDHPRRMYDLAEGLIRRGYSDRDIELILGGNFARVLGELWKASPPAAAAKT